MKYVHVTGYVKMIKISRYQKKITKKEVQKVNIEYM